MNAETRVKIALEYLDKEMTTLGWLAGIPVALVAFLVKDVVLPVKDVVLPDKTHALDLPTLSQVSVALFLVGCLVLLGASAFFLGQRIKTATRYGDITRCLLQSQMPIAIARLTDTIEEEGRNPDSDFWKQYFWGVRLLSLGVFELIAAMGMLFLNRAPGGIWSVIRDYPWAAAILLPIIAYLCCRVGKFVWRGLRKEVLQLRIWLRRTKTMQP